MINVIERNMKLPKKISKCPIIDAVIEIRFESSINSNAIFGIIYSCLQAEYPKVETLPILQVPEPLRENDPVFKYKPHYKISDDQYTIQIGSDVIAFGSVIPYPGWTEFSRKFQSNFDNILKTGIIHKVIRLGVRYINYFDNNIFDNVILEFKSTDNILNLPTGNTVIRTDVPCNSYTSTLQITNNAKIDPENEIVGSLIDIDTFKIYQDMSFLNSYKSEIQNAHNIEKELFFSILKQDYINSLEPVYE